MDRSNGIAKAARIYHQGATGGDLVDVWITGDQDADEQSLVGGEFTVHRSRGVGLLTVNYDVPTGCAVLGFDFEGLGDFGGSVTFEDGVTEMVIPITPIDDAGVEMTEAVELALAAGSGDTVVDPTSAILLITDNDIYETTAQVWLEPGNPVVAEGTVGTITVHRSGGNLAQPLTVTIAIGANAAGDPLAEQDADYSLIEQVGNGPGSSADLIPGLGMATFGANETVVAFQVSARSDEEAEGVEGLRLGRQNTSSEVSYLTDNLTAFAGLDFAYADGRLLFAPSEESKTFTVPILDHAIFGYQAFHLMLTRAVNAVLSTGIKGAIGEIVGNWTRPNQSAPADMPSQMSTPNEPLTRELLESRLKMVLDPGMEALGATTPTEFISTRTPPPTAPKPRLNIGGIQITAASKDTIDWLYENGQFRKNNDPARFDVKRQILARMMNADKASYVFTTKEAAIRNVDFRIRATDAMLRMEKLQKPPIDLGMAGAAADRQFDATYWQKVDEDNSWRIVTKQAVDRFDAVSIGLANGTTKTDCLGAMHAAYLIGAADVLGKEAFNNLFQAGLLIGHNLPFADYDADAAISKLNGLTEGFLALRDRYLAIIAANKPDVGGLRERMDKVRGTIKTYFSDRSIEPVTGDGVYFINSRFYNGVYVKKGDPQPGLWTGENTVASIDEKGKLQFTGLGVGLKTEAQILETLKNNLYVDTAKVTSYLHTLAAQPEVQATALKLGLVAVAYAYAVFEAAARIDIGMFEVFRPRI